MGRVFGAAPRADAHRLGQRQRSGTGKRASILLLLVGILLGGCMKTVVATDLTAFGKAAGDISKQADLSFQESNKLARDVSIDRFVRSGAVGLNEDQFAVAVSQDDIAAWQAALGALEQYGTSIASLVDTSQGSGTSDALAALGTQLNAGRTGANISPGIAGAFASLGGALVNASAQKKARDVLTATDPAIQSLLAQMAEAIGASDAEGLRGTVHTNWNASFQNVQRAYAEAATAHNETKQRQLISEFLSTLDRRDAQLRSLALLRSSLLNLATAHAAAARGSPASLTSLLASIEARLDETKRLYDAFAEKNQSTESKGGKNG